MAQNNQALLTLLAQNGIEFVVIGGVCSVFYGVPVATFDLDVCCPFDEPSLRRLETALRDLHPVHRLTPRKLPFELTSELCSSLKNLYLDTDLGTLDCLSEVAGIGSYPEVREHSVSAKLPYGNFRFLTLDSLILSKEAIHRDRDLQTLRHLRAIKEKLAQKPKPS